MTTALLHDVPEHLYHSDPCDRASLSASIATTLHRQSPLHAWSAHPKLGGRPRKPSKWMDHGTLAHAILLDQEKRIVPVDAEDWRTKAAKEARDEAHAAGNVPVLVGDLETARTAALAIRERLDKLGIALDGHSEVTALWTEESAHGEVQCRGRLDHLKGARILDLKTCRSAHPDACRKHVEAYGYAIQRAAYVSAIEHIIPDFAGRVDFVFLFAEVEPPYAVTPVRLNGEFRTLGQIAWTAAVNTWGRCLARNDWPGYADSILELEPPPWAMARAFEQQANDLDNINQPTAAE